LQNAATVIAKARSACGDPDNPADIGGGWIAAPASIRLAMTMGVFCNSS
jgi:hypothetical protein